MLTHSGLLSETTSTADRAQLYATVPADTILCSDRGIKSQAEVKTCNIPRYLDRTREPQRQDGREGGKKEEEKKTQKGRNAGDMVHESDLGSSRTNAGSLTFLFAVNLSLKSTQYLFSYFPGHKRKPGVSDIKWRPQRDQEGPPSTVMKLKPTAGSESCLHEVPTDLVGKRHQTGHCSGQMALPCSFFVSFSFLLPYR